MAVDVDSLQENLLDEIAFRPDLDPVYKICKHLFDVLRQTRNRTGGSDDFVSDLEASQTSENGGNRNFRRWEDQIQEVIGLLVEVKRQNRALEQRVYELEAKTHKQNTRTLEQQINELEMRLDSGIFS